jgi:hypothetical protein
VNVPGTEGKGRRRLLPSRNSRRRSIYDLHCLCLCVLLSVRVYSRIRYFNQKPEPYRFVELKPVGVIVSEQNVALEKIATGQNYRKCH